FMLRQHQARSAILLSISRKSTGISNYFLNFLSKTQLNQFNQVIVLSEVLIFITADGCAFYSIPNLTQPPFLIFLFGWMFFPQIHPFFCFFIYFLSIFIYFFHIQSILELCFSYESQKISAYFWLSYFKKKNRINLMR
ncbi:hypothetical protein L1A70_19455, partial [Acinetobacter bereziniae]|uniref:hypothetical protein n=1 Tax=Acinetobacter bereziniae TaxID=106648 RepID=UPI0037703EE1